MLTGAGGEDPNAQLRNAVEEGDDVAVRAALRKGADPNHIQGALGPQPLALAAYHGDRRIVQALIAAGASVSPRHESVEAALAGGHIALAELLRAKQEERARHPPPPPQVEKADQHEAAVLERKERLAMLEEEEERRARGEKLAHQMAVMVERQLSEAQAQAERYAARIAKAERLADYERRREALAEEKAGRAEADLQKTLARHEQERRVERWKARLSQRSRHRTYQEWRALMDQKEVSGACELSSPLLQAPLPLSSRCPTA